MNFLKKLFPSAPAQPASKFYAFTVKCDRCGETIAGRINLANDLSVDYEGERAVYHVRKVLVGSGLCFQRIEVEFRFDASHKLLERQATGGHSVENL